MRSRRPGVAIEWDRQAMGAGAFARTRAPRFRPPRSRRSGASRVALKGPIETPVTSGLRSVEPGAAPGARPVRERPPVPAVPGRALALRRRSTWSSSARTPRACTRASSSSTARPGGRRADLVRRGDARGWTVKPDSGISVKEISASASRADRAVRVHVGSASTAAGRVTASHKANIMKFSDGLFLEIARVASPRTSPTSPFDDRIIDALCMQLIQAPERFDVLGAAEHVRRPRGRARRRADRRHGRRSRRALRRRGRPRAGGVRGHPRHRAPPRGHEPGRPGRR